MSWVFAPLSAILASERAMQDAKPQITKAERNAQIVARIKTGEKRSSLATEYGLNIHTISRISIKAGLPKWSRPGRSI